MTPMKFELFDERGALQKTAKIEQIRRSKAIRR